VQNNVHIRSEETKDFPMIWQINKAAFDRDAEADLVNNLRNAGAVTLSLVADSFGQLVGHIMFSPMVIATDRGEIPAVGLGPMAVLPGFQNRGVGSQLVRTGLERLKEMGHQIVIVLGHPWFYPRFGFQPSQPLGIRWENNVPDEVFMVMPLRDGALEGIRGVARYHPAFADV